jgi:SAM-dependent methyltransferase
MRTTVSLQREQGKAGVRPSVDLGVQGMLLSVMKRKFLTPRKRWCFENITFPLRRLAKPSRYCIMSGYHHRERSIYYDATASTDEWQKEVYLYAKCCMEEKELSLVYDVGCGSGFKLMEYLGNFETVGFDVPETVEFLERKYPHRKWQVSRFEDREIGLPDLVVCADVIEHVQDPDQLIEYICAMESTYVIFSTPDRDISYGPNDLYLFGPPSNHSHLREWNFSEFAMYISRRFAIIDHIVTNIDQGTQMIFCRPK